MNINIDSKLVIIVGPSCVGKSTLASKIKKDYNGNAVIISHDDVLAMTPQNHNHHSRNMEFRLNFFYEVGEALISSDNDLVILDTVYYDSETLFNTLMYIKTYIYSGRITLIKMDTPLDLHKKYIKTRKVLNPLIDEDLILRQREYYESPGGSLNCPCNGLVDKVIKMDNPEDVTINYNLRNKGTKKSK